MSCFVSCLLLHLKFLRVYACWWGEISRNLFPWVLSRGRNRIKCAKCWRLFQITSGIHPKAFFETFKSFWVILPWEGVSADRCLSWRRRTIIAENQTTASWNVIVCYVSPVSARDVFIPSLKTTRLRQSCSFSASLMIWEAVWLKLTTCHV